jgi:hypothetical protein
LLMVNSVNTPEERELLHLFRKLGKQNQATLQAFVHFLYERELSEQAVEDEISRLEPKSISRPEDESVIGAIRRLSETFYMLDRSKMLHETSGLMSEHLLQGRDAMEVIDELEVMFQRHFTDYTGEGDR